MMTRSGGLPQTMFKRGDRERWIGCKTKPRSPTRSKIMRQPTSSTAMNRPSGAACFHLTEPFNCRRPNGRNGATPEAAML